MHTEAYVFSIRLGPSNKNMPYNRLNKILCNTEQYNYIIIL